MSTDADIGSIEGLRDSVEQALRRARLRSTTLTDAVAGEAWGGAIHNRLALAWGLGPGGPGADLIRRILVLVADHELNASAFAARVAASTGASRRPGSSPESCASSIARTRRSISTAARSPEPRTSR